MSTSDWSRARQRSRVAARWLPAIIWMAVIFGLSSISGLRVSEDAAIDRPLRVLAHACTYALLAGLLLYALAGLGRPRRRHVAAALVITLLYGLSDEIHQATVPQRSGRAEDLVVDAVGAAAGLALAWLALGRAARRDRSAELAEG